MAIDDITKRKTRTVYVSEDEYEYLKRQLKIYRARQILKEETARDSSTEERARAPQGDSHA